jgi:hypothetical protein
MSRGERIKLSRATIFRGISLHQRFRHMPAGETGATRDPDWKIIAVGVFLQEEIW